MNRENLVAYKISQLTRVALLSFSALIFVVTSVNAQGVEPTGNGFRVSPVRTELTIPKGRSETVVVSVENPSETPVRVTPEINNFVADEDESGSPRLILDDSVLPPRNDLKRLVSPLEGFTITAGQRKEIPVTISVPNDANAGGYYGAVRFIPELPTPEGRNVALTGSVGTIFLIEVPGDLKQQLNLVQFGAAEGNSYRGFFIGGKVNVLTRLKNTGDIHVKPFGKVQIKNMFGKIVHEYEFNNTDPRANVLPDSTRRFVDEIPQKGWFGRYTIKTNLGYSSGGGELISANASFWYFATWVFYGLIALLLIIIAAIYWLVRRRTKRHGHKN